MRHSRKGISQKNIKHPTSFPVGRTETSGHGLEGVRARGGGRGGEVTSQGSTVSFMNQLTSRVMGDIIMGEGCGGVGCKR